MATLQERNGSYRVLFVYHGRRESFTLGAVPKPLAEAKAAKVDELLAMLRGGYLTVPENTSVGDFMRADGKPPEVRLEAGPKASPSPASARSIWQPTAAPSKPTPSRASPPTSSTSPTRWASSS